MPFDALAAMRRRFFPRRPRLDPATGRPFGDHGTAAAALEFAFERIDDPAEQVEFLQDWYKGDAAEYWPMFYEWLRERGR